MSTKMSAAKRTNAKGGKRAPGRRPKNMPKAGTYSGSTALAVTAPSAVTAVMRKAPLNPVRIQFREEASDVICQADFENSSFIVNPGNEDLFPWMGPIAQQFTTFEFNSIKHEYVASTDTSTSGTVVMAVNADPDKPPFATEKEIINHMGSATASPWASFSIDGKSKSTTTLGPRKYVADVTGETALSGILDDIRTVATGVLNIATVGLSVLGAEGKGVDPDPKTTGKLFTSYDVTLWDPVDSTLTADEGISLFISDPAAPTLLNVPSSFEGEPLNPLRIKVTDVTAGGSTYSVTEPGIYAIEVVLEIADISPGVAYGDLATVFWNPATGTNAPVQLSGPNYPSVNQNRDRVNLGGIWEFPSSDTADCFLTLNVGDPGYVLTNLIYNPTTTVTFVKVSNLLDFHAPALYRALPKGSRGCTPDCPKSAIVSYIREDRRRETIAKGNLAAIRSVSRLGGQSKKKTSLTVQKLIAGAPAGAVVTNMDEKSKGTSISENHFAKGTVKFSASAIPAIPAYKAGATASPSMSKSMVAPH